MSSVFTRILMVAAASLVLTACDKPKEAAATAPAAAVSLAALQSEARGFAVGPAMSARTVYVFFDPQCPHCAALWESAKPLKSQARFVWIPVRVLNKTSEEQGASLLAAADPVKAMDEHEASMKVKGPGIQSGPATDAQRPAVTANTALMTRYGFASVPTIVAAHAQTGALSTHEGSMSTSELASFLGLQVPAGGSS
jgi:thiol:disulfide interchange protein DsbG